MIENERIKEIRSRLPLGRWGLKSFLAASYASNVGSPSARKVGIEMSWQI